MEGSIKTTMSYLLTLVKMTINKENQDTMRVSDNVEKRDSLHIVGGTESNTDIRGKVLRLAPYKIKSKITI